MDINELKTKYPELYNQVFQLGAKFGAEMGQKMINGGHENIVRTAQLDTGITPKEMIIAREIATIANKRRK